MRRSWLGLLLAVLATGTVLVAQEFSETEFKKATTTILCDCGCHPQSVDQCACGRAAEMRDEIAALIREGKTGDDVIELYVAEHGEQIRIAPTADDFNLVAWVGPGLGLIAASLGMLLLLRRWKRAQEEPEATAARAAVSDPAHDEYRRRLRQALEGLE